MMLTIEVTISDPLEEDVRKARVTCLRETPTARGASEVLERQTRGPFYYSQ